MPGELATRARALTAGIDKTLQQAAEKDAAAHTLPTGLNPFAAKKVAVKAGRRYKGPTTVAKPSLSNEEWQQRRATLEQEVKSLKEKLTSLRKASASTTRVVQAPTKPVSIKRPSSRGSLPLLSEHRQAPAEAASPMQAELSELRAEVQKLRPLALRCGHAETQRDEISRLHLAAQDELQKKSTVISSLQSELSTLREASRRSELQMARSPQALGLPDPDSMREIESLRRQLRCVAVTHCVVSSLQSFIISPTTRLQCTGKQSRQQLPAHTWPR